MRYRIETERENLFDVNMMIAMRVRLNDMPPFECISDAFYKAVRTYEILCSRVVIEDSGEAFYVDCDTPGSSFAESVLSFEELINVNEKIRFKVEDGEYIRVFSTSDGITASLSQL